jgi:predicted DsbA family dithiol-disulfide isomerase
VVISAPNLVAGGHNLSAYIVISPSADTSSTTGGLVSSTHLVHRLQTYTLLSQPDLQLPLAMSLFSLVHEAGVAPSDRPALASVAVQHGVFPSQEEAMRFLDSDECDGEVKRAYTMARRVGVTGVPFFVFQDRYAASGAMGVDEFVKVSGRGRGRGRGRDDKSEPGAGVRGVPC